MFSPSQNSLTRADLFELGLDAPASPEAARRLLWATLAWGTGTRNRNNLARVRSVARNPVRLGELLQVAATTSRANPVEAYRVLRPKRNAIAYLGPPFFTKFLYFAGGGVANHPSLILDSVVAGRLRTCGWMSLSAGYVWSAETYGSYCTLLRRWAATATGAVGTPVAADQLERNLFQGRQPDRGV